WYITNCLPWPRSLASRWVGEEVCGGRGFGANAEWIRGVFLLRLRARVPIMLPSQAVRRGFTLVELLVGISIIGVLMSLLLPAVQSAREAGRRAQCLNNLHQLALASLQHEEKLRRFPNGGWGPLWVGDPDAGSGVGSATDVHKCGQPGGWIYNILPYIEQTQLHDLGISPPHAAAQPSARGQRGAVQVPGGSRPSRRSGQQFPVSTSGAAPPGAPAGDTGWTPPSRQPYETDPITTAGRSDYAINCGTRFQTNSSG